MKNIVIEKESAAGTQMESAYKSGVVGMTLYSMDWTTETPTQEGWYWVDYAGGITLVEVFDNRGVMSIETGYDGAMESVKEQKYHTHWLGPLPYPEMPE